MRDRHALQVAAAALALCLAGAAAQSNPLQGLENAINSAISTTNSSLQNVTKSTGSAVTSATNATTGALQSATSSVGQGLNTAVNATQNATTQCASPRPAFHSRARSSGAGADTPPRGAGSPPLAAASSAACSTARA